MRVRITKKIAEIEPNFFERITGKTLKYDFNRSNFIDIDLNKLVPKDVKRLRDISEENLTEGRDFRSLNKDVKVYNAIKADKDGAKTTRARTVRQAVDLLIEYFIRHSPKKWVFEKIQRGDDSVTVPYFIDKIVYHPRETRRDYQHPEHGTIHGIYNDIGSVRSATWTFYSEKCIGLTARELLATEDLHWETSIMKDDYQIYLDRYTAWWDKVGMQMLATGSADFEGVDGNSDDEDDYWHQWRRHEDSIRLDKDGEPARVVVDVQKESEKDTDTRSDANYSMGFWNNRLSPADNGDASVEYEDESSEEDDSDELTQKIDIPIHPFVICFDLKRHKRMRIHTGNLEPYVYNKEIRDQLILPESNSKLIDVLLTENDTHFKDIVKGKTGGVLILCQGPPGTGKTLTAEVYSEVMERPLYTVQCSQLGVDAQTLEKNLLKILLRGRRWNAVMLLDEADVYIHRRGDDLIQNAIVGVFLRVLEYQSGVLFMTTNRGDLVDDAILSRCTARIPYGAPDITQQHKIWRVLADVNGIELGNRTVKEIVDAHPKLSGRDIKNLLKIAAMVAHDRGEKINADLVAEMKIFKPTIDQMEE